MARNNFDFGLAGADIDLQGATIHNYSRNWVGVPTPAGQTPTPQPGQSVAYGAGDIVYHANQLWYASSDSDNIEPGTSTAHWMEITSEGGSIGLWDMTASYIPNSVVISDETGGFVLYIWRGTVNATGANIPGTDDNWRAIAGGAATHDVISSGVGIRLDAHLNSIRVSLAPNVNQNMTFDQNVTVEENLTVSGNVNLPTGEVTANRLTAEQAVDTPELNSTTIENAGAINTAEINATRRATVPDAALPQEAVNLRQLETAENRIINRAREEFEIMPMPVHNHEFNYYRTFENTDENIFDSDATMIPVTLPIGTQISQFPPDHEDHPNEVNIVYPTSGPGAGARSSTGRRLSGTLYTSPSSQTFARRGLLADWNTEEIGDTRLIGTRYAGYREDLPEIQQELWRHGEMWVAADFEIVLRYRLQGDPGNTVTLRETWPNTRLNIEAWNHNLLYHHRSLPGVTDGGDDDITAGPLLNYFAGAVGLTRNGAVEGAPGRGTYQNGDRYLGNYIPGSYISVAPNFTIDGRTTDDSIENRLQTNQTARSFGLFASATIHSDTSVPGHGADMRPLVYTAIPCPWKVISDTIRHNYINDGTATDTFPASTVSEISGSNIFHFTRAEHRGFQESGDRYVEPIDTTVTDAFAPLIPEVFIEVGSNYGEVLEMELEFNVDNFRYMQEFERGGNITAEPFCSVYPRAKSNPFTQNDRPFWDRTEGLFATTVPRSVPLQDYVPSEAALPPAKWLNLESTLNQGSSISADPYFVMDRNNVNGYNFGFLYGGNSERDQQRRFRAESAITGNGRQLYNESWAADDYDVACATFNPSLMTLNFDPRLVSPTNPIEDIGVDTYAVFSRPATYTPNIGTGELFPGITLQGETTATVPVKFGRVPDRWDSRRAYGSTSGTPYSAGDIVLSMGVLDRANSQEPLIVDESRLRYWIALRDPRLEPDPDHPGEMRVVEADRQGPAHQFAQIGTNVGRYNSLWVPLAWNRVQADNDTGVYAPLNEQIDTQKTDPIYPMFTPGNYTVGHGPEYPAAFENYEITGLPVVINKNAISTFSNRDSSTAEGDWTLRSTLADRTHTDTGLLGRFNPSVFHFRKSDDTTSATSFIDFAFAPERAGEPSDSGASQYVFQIAPGGRGTPPLTGYLDPYENLVVDSFRVASNNGTDASLPNTRVAGRMNTTQNPFRDWDSTNAILHCIPQSNIRPTGTLDRDNDNGQDIYMPQLAVLSDGSRDADGNLIYTWKCESNTYQAAGNAPLDQGTVGTGTLAPLTPFGWEDHDDYLRINFQAVLDNGEPDSSSSASETLYNIIGWNPGDGHFRVVRVEYDSVDNPNPARNEPAWQPDNPMVTASTFFNFAQYRNGTVHGVDFLQAGTDSATRIAGEVSVLGEDGITVNTAVPTPWSGTEAYRRDFYVSYLNHFYNSIGEIFAPGPMDPDNEDPETNAARPVDDPLRVWTLLPGDYDRSQLILGINGTEIPAGPPNDILENANDTGNPLPFGMFGLIDLFLGQQFSNRVDGTEQTGVVDTDFEFFERYRRRGTSYYWYPNRAAVVTADGTPTFFTRETLFPDPNDRTIRQTDLRLKSPTVFQEIDAADPASTTPLPRSVSLDRPSSATYFAGETGSIRFRWGDAADVPDFNPNRYYVIYGTDSVGRQIQLLFTSGNLVEESPTDRLLTLVAETWAPGPDNAFIPGSTNADNNSNFFQGTADVRMIDFPIDDYRIFEGIWQNYYGTGLPNQGMATGQWRTLLEG